MNILSLCSRPEVLQVMVLVKLLVRAICVIVPIIMIVTMSVDYMKAVGNSDDTMVFKVTKKIPYRAIAAVFIFFVPSLVKILVFIVDSNADGIYSCIENATPELIETTYQNNSRNLLDRLKDSLSIDDYNNAKSMISEIEDEIIKNEYLDELNELKKYIDIKSEINKLISNYNKDDYVKLIEKIDKIEDKEIRDKLLLLVEEIKGQKPLNIQSGTFQKKFTGSKDWLNYWEFIPNNPTTNMPIVIFLHGDGEVNNINAIKNIGFIRGTKSVYGDDFPYIVLQPNTRVTDWTRDSIKTTVKELIDKTCEDYLCDTEHIIITGMSRGAVGTWHMVNTYKDYFSAAVPVSCIGNINANNFVKVPVRAFVGSDGGDYDMYYSGMKSNVDKINAAGGDAALEVVQGGTHGSTYHIVYARKSLIEWMLEQ